MTLRDASLRVGVDDHRSDLPRYVAEWVCLDCDFSEFRVTTGTTGNVVRCPSCGGSLVLPQDAMS